MTEVPFGTANIEAIIRKNTGQLVSFMLTGTEFMHSGGREGGITGGWGNSAITMWPFVGQAINDTLWLPSNEVPEELHKEAREAYKLRVGDIPSDLKKFIPFHQTQHGMLRYMIPTNVKGTGNGASVLYEFSPDKRILGDKSDEALWLPYRGSLQQTYHVDFGISKATLVQRTQIRNTGTHPMRFRHGWHPSFALETGAKSGLILGELHYNGKEKQSFPQDAETFFVSGETISYTTEKREVHVTHDFGAGQIWLRGKQICLEPVTSTEESAPYMRFEAGNSLRISPGGSMNFTARITFLVKQV